MMAVEQKMRLEGIPDDIIRYSIFFLIYKHNVCSIISCGRSIEAFLEGPYRLATA